ncbi:LOW QUALITY PROTEIN: forkhead box protein N1-like [Oncorhynchus tshawytscha]|uniref:LOW QUALITY PROTEIN: forkhead box protein N1-like n=1 Tax=Oncorhynchus tshawytscha TaxID=74940 RepID=UPI001C3D5ACB|nr:LOW QUALITY PROTEIN: forkhead box protein N1-like [Oncorhynchus tshawytscha]
MSTESPSSTCTHSANRSLTTTPAPQISSLRTCEPPGSSLQQMVHSQCDDSSSVSFTTAQREKESATYRQRNAAAETCRRHSIDGAMVTQSQRSNLGSVSADRFHPYRRQFSNGGVATGWLAPGSPVPPGSHPFISLGEVQSPDGFTDTSTSEEQTCWDTYNGSFQASRLMQGSQHSYPEPLAAPKEPSCFLSQGHASYSPLAPLQQFSPGVYSTSGKSKSSQYSLQCLSTPTHQDSSMQSLFPKPIYSYSILIFMALRNSKTGSLPVSEIYRFMTEHFPYFKTAPDGWKNSVRHNLSLNKCFEKVENKIGNSSRKGCLWALNPAKIEKMQEELHKWRRKDPLTVRKSMARPEDLDRLLGERPGNLKSLPFYHQTPLARSTTNYNPTPSSFTSSQPPEPCRPLHVPSTPTSPFHPDSQPAPPLHVPPPPPPLLLLLPCGQQPPSGIPPNVGTLGSPLAGQTPSNCSATIQAEYKFGPRSMQELQLEGDASNDIDTLNPSLTDLQLHGYLWEELREDSLAPDSLVAISPSSSPSSSQPTHFLLGSSLRSTCPVNQTSELISVGLGKEEEEDEEEMDGGCGGPSDLHIYGQYHTAYTGVESLAGYLASMGNTPIPLL